ncbi:MAG TPA: translation elongation factor Ts [Candidatus Paceibacterota bacterium]
MSDLDTIKEIREATNFSFNEIKKALDEAGGDKSKALGILKERGAAVAEKKSTRSTGQGIVEAYVHSNKKIGVILEILCETDFVARNPMFIELSREVAMHVAAMDPQDVQELLGQAYIRDQSLTIEEFINQYIAKLGENIKIGKFCRLQL